MARRNNKQNILILHGPNLNLLGEREPEIYGALTLNQINGLLKKECKRLGIHPFISQSNHEGELIDLLHSYRKRVDAVVINPGAYTHYSYALRDAIASIQLPTIEVHLSDITKRETFRKTSVIAPVCVKQIFGHGWKSYAMALEHLAGRAPLPSSPSRDAEKKPSKVSGRVLAQNRKKKGSLHARK